MSLCQLLYCMQASSTDKLQCLSGMSPKQLGLTLVSNTRCQVSNSTFFLPHKKSRNIIFDCGVLCPKLIRFRYRSMKKLDGTVDGIETVATLLPLVRNGWRLLGPAPDLEAVEAHLSARRSRRLAREHRRSPRRELPR